MRAWRKKSQTNATVARKGRFAMTRVTSSLQPSIITTVATGLLLLAVSVDLLSGVRRPICSASAPVTTTSVRLRHSTVKTFITTDVTTSNHSVAQNNNNNGAASKRRGRMERRNRQHQDKDDLSLWIDQQQVKMFSGMPLFNPLSQM